MGIAYTPQIVSGQEADAVHNTMLLHLLFWTLLVFGSATSSLDCFLDEQECEMSVDNHLDTVMGVLKMTECLDLCNEDIGCKAFTYLVKEEACRLFSSCPALERRPCEDCSTGSSQTECLCGINYHQSEVNSGDLLEMIPGISGEQDCKSHCANSEKCKVYTYYDVEDAINPDTCFLMNSFALHGSPVTACNHCSTGSGRCELNQRCQAAIITNGSSIQAISAEESMSFDLVAGEKDCYVELKIVGVGGGGGAGDYGGSGSGFVETLTVQINSSNPQGRITVGQVDESSKVEIAGSLVLEALPGQKGDYNGGAGCSGGGGYGTFGGGGEGGSGGSDGESGTIYPGGSGSGFHVENVAMENFILVPGSGGEPYGDGGGGGGVIVNGKVPGSSEYGGSGFGGGSGGHFNGQGFPGCVLVEIQN